MVILILTLIFDINIDIDINNPPLRLLLPLCCRPVHMNALRNLRLTTLPLPSINRRLSQTARHLQPNPLPAPNTNTHTPHLCSRQHVFILLPRWHARHCQERKVGCRVCGAELSADSRNHHLRACTSSRRAHPTARKVQIMLEELADVYETEWTTTLINIMTNEQKKDWFLKLDPNGRIPVLVDNTQSPPFCVMETSAELLYLLKFADKDDKFGFKDELERNEALQWLFFWHGSGAPYQGQLNHFGKFAKDKIPYAIERFKNETLRVYGVLEIRLSGKYTGEPREYLAGNGKGKYSVADIGTWPWVKGWSFSGLQEEDMKPFPHLMKWIDRIAERPAVKRGTGDKYSQ
ncbi:glutathione S-transferase [Cryomyces antarcticus]